MKYIIRQNKEGHYKRTVRPSMRSRILNGIMPVRDGIDMLLWGKPGDKIKRI